MNAHVFGTNPIAGFFKKAAAFVGLTSMVLGGGAAGAIASNSVSFNNIQGDYPTLQVAKSGENWSTATTAAPGDTVSLLVWDHNTNPDVVAQNVNIKVSLPTGYASSFAPTATVSADNGAAATGPATVSVGSQAQMTYIPGSAHFYKNVGGQMTEVSFPSGVNGDQIVNGGVNLGSQNGCWEYAQAVVIQVKIQGGTAALHTEKNVALFNSATYGTSVTAQPGDVVAFRVYVENTGTGAATNVKVTDTLDNRFAYIAGTSTVRTKQGNNDVDTAYADSQISVNGQTMVWSFPNMDPNASSAFYLTFQAKIADKAAFAVGSTVLYNTAVATATGISATTNQVSVTVNRAQDEVVTFTIGKTIHGNGNQWLHQAVGVAPGTIVRYSLQVADTGNTDAKNVYVKDILPAGIAYAGNASIYTAAVPGGTAIDGNALFSNGYLLSTLTHGTGGSITIEFDAKVTTTDCAGTPSLVNTGQVIYNGQVRAQDTAIAVLSCTKGLSIVKDIQDVDGTFKDQIGQVKEDQVLTYRIVVTNTGNTTAVNPVLRDVLPQFVTYVNNSMTIDGAFTSQAVQNGFLGINGALLTNFTPGMSKEIRFQVKVVSCPNLGDTTLTNTGYVKADGVAEISDTATATLHVNKAVLAPVF